MTPPKIIPLINLLNFWLYDCLTVTVRNPSTGKYENRNVGFYHLRRQNIMPFGIEIYVISVGFTVPIANELFIELRKYSSFGEPDSTGRYRGGTRSVANRIEAIFHLILEIKNASNMPELRSESSVMIGDEPELKTIRETSKLRKTMKEKRNESENNSQKKERAE